MGREAGAVFAGFLDVLLAGAAFLATFLLDTDFFLAPFFVDTRFEDFFFDAPFFAARVATVFLELLPLGRLGRFLRAFFALDLRDAAVTVFFLLADFFLLLAAAFALGIV